MLTGEEGMSILWLATWNSVLVKEDSLAREGVFRYKSQRKHPCLQHQELEIVKLLELPQGVG